ncbi:autotransporter domain-containing protein [Paraburkholderia sp.]|uniref:autotransporter outer membrane beta-barrel domain-containing protein n=1 Tax=Paraburkholderia sp. TaxID=1926495 RepID=UPI0039E4025D
MRWRLQVLFATVLLALQGILGSTVAFALSTGCTQVNALSTTSTHSTFPAADFDAGDTLTVSFYNDGLDTSGFEPTSDHVLVETAAYSPYLVFYASDHTTAGSQSVTVPAGNLSSSGLNLFVSTTNGNIGNVVYSCTNTAAAAPVAGNATATVAANSSSNAITLNITGGTATSVAVASAASHGTATASGTSITYTPASGYSGTDSFTYTATNSTGTSSAATVTITVTAPTLAFSPAAGALPAGTVGTAYSRTITVSNGLAPYTMSLSTTGNAAGSVTTNSATVAWTPTSAGTYNITVNATDADGVTGTAAYTITVTEPAPVAGAVSATVAANSSANAITLNLSGGTATSVAVASAASHGTATASGTSITYTPISGYSGSDSFTYTATNGTGTSAAATVTITVSSPTLVFTPSAGALASGAVNAAYSQSVAVTGGTSPYTYAATGLPAGLSISSSSGTISGTPTASGNFTVAVTATDANHVTGAVNYTLYVAPLTPVASNVSATVAENSTNNAITLNVAGGAATSVAIVSAARHGVAAVSGTSITYTPSTGYTGADSFTYSATNASGSSSATVNITVSGSVPVAEDHTAALYAGQTVSVNLSEGATGGPFSGSSLVSEPAASQGTAKISTNGSGYTLTFTAATQASGAVLIRYTLTNSWGTSTPATVTLQVTTRPDPSKDAEVIGLLNAQAQSAEQFANAQIGNFNERLEQLHSERTRHDSLFDVHVGLPQTRAAQSGTQASAMPSGISTGDSTAAHEATQQARTANDGPTQPQWLASGDLAVWTGGFVNFGTSDQDAIHLSHTLVGLSAGADYRFLPSFVAGFGVGYGRDVSDVGSSGTQSKGEAFSAAFYGSFHPGPVYVDGLLGYSHLNFDSRRYVTETGAFANGSRAGDQVFGALTSGYELRSGAALVAPYARVQFSSTLLRHYAETDAGAFNLAYADQRLNNVSGVAGLRGEYGIPTSWAAIRLRGRIEYSHALTGTSTARLGYADTDDNSYAVTVLGLSENQLTTAVGVDLQLPSGLTTGLTYQGTFGMSDHTRNHEFLVRVSLRF